MTDQDLRYMFTAALPHIFDFTKNAKALLPVFIDPDQSGTAGLTFNWTKRAPRQGTGNGIFTAFAQNLYLQGFLRSKEVAGKDLRDHKMSFDHRSDTGYGQFLSFGRFRRLRSTDAINAPLHIMLRTIALARLSELAGEMPANEAAVFYQACAPRVKDLMRSEKSWDTYLTNAASFCKLLNRSRWRKVSRAKSACLKPMESCDIYPSGTGISFSNAAKEDFAAIKKDERQRIFDLADDGDWKAVTVYIDGQTDDMRGVYLALFTPENIEAVIIADLEADPLKSETKDLILANFYVQWGYDARGRSGADQVGADNFRLFEDRLHKAMDLIRPYLEGENPSHEVLLRYLDIRPHVWFEDKPDLDKKAEQDASRLFPDSYLLARRRLHFMVEKWGGSKERAWQFATELSDQYPDDRKLACLPYYAMYEEYLSLEMIQGEQQGSWDFIRGDEAKKRLAPYRDRILNGGPEPLAACYSIPIGWYIRSRQYAECWQMAQAVGGCYAKDGFFGTYILDENETTIESYLINLFAQD